MIHQPRLELFFPYLVGQENVIHHCKSLKKYYLSLLTDKKKNMMKKK